ncbi:hypothetical protein GCM10010274_65470 [Streptomyces lavendofoliae]|uniref:Uncharacterized protein n=1 Tax=Streptomyces lavendofoliae TaxID=67314 RepID=A0A918M7N0_9ACTN|nr:hypothetical protein GCM10010274_65470 [Streptomyces lavendofoliae]
MALVLSPLQPVKFSCGFVSCPPTARHDASNRALESVTRLLRGCAAGRLSSMTRDWETMKIQWRTRYPLPERTVTQLRRSRWVFAGFTLLEAFALVMALIEDHRSAWTVTWTGIGTVFFPLMLLGSQYQLRKNRRITRALKGPPATSSS